MSPFFADKSRHVDLYSERNISCLDLVPKTCWEDMFVSQQCKPYQRLHQVYNYLLCVLSLTINVNGGYWRLLAMVRCGGGGICWAFVDFMCEGWAWAWYSSCAPQDMTSGHRTGVPMLVFLETWAWCLKEIKKKFLPWRHFETCLETWDKGHLARNDKVRKRHLELVIARVMRVKAAAAA